VKLLFSEAEPDHAHYVYPYVVWGFLEAGETPADAFSSGFLPSSPHLDRFYLARHLRLPLGEWKASSENRRVLRKAARLKMDLVPKPEFDYSPMRRASWLRFADARFGAGVMSGERLDRLMAGRVITHLLHFSDPANGEDVGTVLMYVEAPRLAYYYYAFYTLDPDLKSAGLGMMVSAAEHFLGSGCLHLYLGTCYAEKALYKTQFEPLEFFNGFRWSRNMAELKHLIRVPPAGHHRLEIPEFLAFQSAPPFQLAQSSNYRAVISPPLPPLPP